MTKVIYINKTSYIRSYYCTMKMSIKNPSKPLTGDTIERNEHGQRILIGILSINGQDLVAEGSLNEYLDRIQWEIDDLGTVTVNSDGIITHADFILDETELEKLKIWSMTSYNYLLSGKST